mgnify:CR=1 FL=1
MRLVAFILLITSTTLISQEIKRVDSERSSINPIRIEYYGDHKPASTLVEVSALVDPRMRVEVEAVAYIGKE